MNDGFIVEGNAHVNNLVHVQSGFDHLLVLGEVCLQVSERRDKHGLQQNLEASWKTKKEIKYKYCI